MAFPTSEAVKDIRQEKLRALFAEILEKMKLNESGEFYISWKGSSVAVSFKQWIKTEALTSRPLQ